MCGEIANVAAYWILFALCFLCARRRMCLWRCSARPRFSCLVWRADGRVGALLKEISAVVSFSSFSSPLSHSHLLLLPSFFSPLSGGFHLPVTSPAAAFLSSLHLLRAILVAEESFFPLSIFSPSPSVPSWCASQGSARRQYTVALE